MFLQTKQMGTLVEVLDVEALSDPTEVKIRIKDQEGQEEQEPTTIAKENLIFPSGENLPRCWVDADYRGKNT